ncbi:stage VI sporulation protein D [Virgibacillus soli]|uniref:stage VI sporulation protein D n=1 Tax=Paracerasibacillus soli TaxID=480284 RepID=UPI0035EC580D
MFNDQSVFSFDLEESLYFEREQEVAEIVSISLDPEISIQSFHDYISIRGVISLQGQYVPVQNQEAEESSFQEFQSKRYIEKVEKINDTFAQFSHRFPVEISVPAYRVANLEDVTVNITTFDYELPHTERLIVKSTVEIHGISNEADPNKQRMKEKEIVERVVEHDEVLEVEQADDDVNEAQVLQEQGELTDTFEFEIKKKKEEEKEIVRESEPEAHVEEKNDVQNDSTEEEEDPERWKKKKTQTLAEFFGTDSSEETVESPHSSDIDQDDYDDYDDTENDDDGLETVEYDEYEAYDDNYDDREVEVADLSYLSDMIRNHEETYTKMRLCIVQENDTLERIAERYETTTMHIMKRNHMQDEDVVIGQLLNIPVKKKRENK